MQGRRLPGLRRQPHEHWHRGRPANSLDLDNVSWSYSLAAPHAGHEGVKRLVPLGSMSFGNGSASAALESNSGVFVLESISMAGATDSPNTPVSLITATAANLNQYVYG